MNHHWSATSLVILSSMLLLKRCAGYGVHKKNPLRANMFSRLYSQGPPLEPKNFGKSFSIEPYASKLDLETFHAHKMDSRIVFDDISHTYYVDGKKISRSVTDIVGSYFQKFDGPSIVQKMMNGPRWPRPEYTVNGRPMTESEILAKWFMIIRICSCFWNSIA